MAEPLLPAPQLPPGYAQVSGTNGVSSPISFGGAAPPDLGAATFSTVDIDATIWGKRRLNASSAVNDEIGWDVRGMEAGVYTVTVVTDKGPNRGIVTPYVDGVAIGAATDLYNAGSTIRFVWSITGVEVAAGNHRLSLKVTSKNASSSAHVLVINEVILTRTGDPT